MAGEDLPFNLKGLTVSSEALKPASVLAPTDGEKGVGASNGEKPKPKPNRYVMPKDLVDSLLNREYSHIPRYDDDEATKCLSKESKEAWNEAAKCLRKETKEAWNEAADFFNDVNKMLAESKKALQAELDEKGYIELDDEYYENLAENQAISSAAYREACEEHRCMSMSAECKEEKEQKP